MTPFSNPEDATPLDPQEMDGLRNRHITTRGELDRWEHDNIDEAIAWLERRRKGDILSEDFIRKLHEKMFNKVWRWAGSFRLSDKSIGVSWTQVAVELRQLLDDVRYWIDNSTFDSDEIAYRFHHRLVYIHLFPNGNGRHARLMADTLLVEVFERDSFTWGSGDLSNAGKTRGDYIASLKAADVSEYQLLSDFVRS